MLSSLTAGVLLGLSAGFVPGPLLALVVTQTLKHDTREGLKVAVAPLITDVPVILASVFLLTSLTHFRPVLGGISFAGSLYVLYLACEGLKTTPVRLDTSDLQPHSIRKGALINALNPHPYLFWVTVGTPFMLNARQASRYAPLAFLAGFYLFLVGSKMFLAVLVGRSRDFLLSRAYVWIMRSLGALLALFALLLLREALRLWGLWGA